LQWMVVIMKNYRVLDKVRVNHSWGIPDPILSTQTKADNLWENPKLFSAINPAARWLNK